MDSLARNLDDLRSVVQILTGKGARVEFAKEGLVFTGEDSPRANLMLSVMGAFAEFERSLITERQREGIALAKTRGVYKGRKRALGPEQVVEMIARAAAGIPKAQLGREYGLSRETVYQHLRRSGPVPRVMAGRENYHVRRQGRAPGRLIVNRTCSLRTDQRPVRGKAAPRRQCGEVFGDWPLHASSGCVVSVAFTIDPG